jgi:hypothetical protein
MRDFGDFAGWAGYGEGLADHLDIKATGRRCTKVTRRVHGGPTELTDVSVGGPLCIV